MNKIATKTRYLLEMIRLSHTLFALPFAMLAAVMAWSTSTIAGTSVGFRWQDLLGILLCMVAARSAAMAFNRLVDRDIDAQNPRTESRHLPSGKLSVTTVVLFVLICAAAFVLCTLIFLPNRLPFYLSLPVLVVICCYSYTKRFTSLAHFWLGFSLMLAPIAGWIAIRGDAVMENPLDLVPPVCLGWAVLFWVAGFDMIYSCQDYEFDRQSNLKSVPAKWGVGGALRLAAACHLVMILLLLALPLVSASVGIETGLGWIYYLGVLAVAVLLIYEHWIVRPDDLARVNVAFFNVNAIVSFGLFLVGSLDILV